MCLSHWASTCLVCVLQVNACIKFSGKDSATNSAHIGADPSSDRMPCAMSGNLMHAKLYESRCSVLALLPSAIINVLACIGLIVCDTLGWNKSTESQSVGVISGSS